MSTPFCLKVLAGAALAAGTLSANALTMTLNNWTYGSGQVNVTVGTPSINYVGGGGGGFSGTLTGSTGHDTNNLMTYCTEINQDFSFGVSYTNDYTVLSAASYFGSTKALELARMFSWAMADPTRVNNSTESTGLQLAVWNIVYDTDLSVTSGNFHVNDSTTSDSYANMLLSHAGDAGQSQTLLMYLLHSGSPGNHQDQLFWETPNGQTDNSIINVPEPASVALVGVALAGLGLSRRTRRG